MEEWTKFRDFLLYERTNFLRKRTLRKIKLVDLKKVDKILKIRLPPPPPPIDKFLDPRLVVLTKKKRLCFLM